MYVSCPGAKNLKQPQPQNTKCPFCDYELEIWSDEIKVKCPHCQKTVIRKQVPTCLDWCRYAKECAGDRIYKNYMRNKRISLKENLNG